MSAASVAILVRGDSHYCSALLASVGTDVRLPSRSRQDALREGILCARERREPDQGHNALHAQLAVEPKGGTTVDKEPFPTGSLIDGLCVVHRMPNIPTLSAVKVTRWALGRASA